MDHTNTSTAEGSALSHLGKRGSTDGTSGHVLRRWRNGCFGYEG